ncbi:MAG: acyltransferase [Clostridia bacterium]|nr:acyltransferase [Clostridia bacterium]
MPYETEQELQLFEQLTRYAHETDNEKDNRRRAEILDFGGRDIMIAPGAIIRVKDKTTVGRNIFIGLYCYINGNVIIEDDVLIGPHCSITAGHHKFDPATASFSARTNKDYDNSIVIGKGSWLASGVTVTAGIRIGKANLICAGAVVTKSTPDFAIMAGVPARQAGRIDPVTGEYIWFSREEKK